uniref:Uncharacterized protein n=1 Tax=Trichuris muris TaxID=70415 RepID=A0A5S6QA92_TRIMR
MVTFKTLCRMTEVAMVEYLQQNGLLHRERKCARDHTMKLKESRRGRCPVWRCQVGGCNQMVSVRCGTWLDGPRRRASIEIAVLFMYI